MSKKNLFMLCLMAILMVSLLGCAQKPNTFKIMLALKEGFPFNDFYLQSVQLAIEESQALAETPLKIELVPFHYSGTEKDLSAFYLEAVNKEKPTIFIGTIFSGDVLAMMRGINEAKIPFITLGTATALTEKDNPYILRASVSDQNMCRVAIKYITEVLKAKRIGLLYSEGVFGVGAYQDINTALKTYDNTLAYVESYPQNIAPADLANKMKALNQEHLDLSILWSDFNELPLMASAMDLEPLSMPFLGNQVFIDVNTLSPPRAYMEKNFVLAHFLQTPQNTQFGYAMKKRYGVELTPKHSPLMYDIAAHILKVAHSNDGVVVPSMLNQALRKEPYQGQASLYHYNESGEGVFQTFIGEVRNGEVIFRKIEVLE